MLLWLLACAPPVCDASALVRDEADLIAFFGACLGSQGVPGGVLALTRAEGEPVVVAAGTDDLDAGTAMEPDRAFMVGSLTKTFTGAVVLSLVAEGRLSLDDPADQWVEVGEGITIRHLLTHTSGLPDYMDHADLYRDRSTPRDPEWLVERALDLPPLPLGEFRYANTNFVVLGMVTSALTGDWAGSVRERALDPLALSGTWIRGEEAATATLAIGYKEVDGELSSTFTQTDPSIPWAAGAMASTGEDLARWSHALVIGAVQGEALADEMLVDAVPRDGSADDDRWYGLGVSVDQSAAGTTIGHHGRANGHDTWFAWYPEREVGVVVLLNRHRGDGDPMAIAAIAADLGYP